MTIIWSVILVFLIYVGLMTDLAQSVCYRPNFTDPYAIVLTPDQATYQQYSPIVLNCLPGHTPQGFPTGNTTYCNYADPVWNPDPTEVLCFAQCNATIVFDNDINVRSSDGSQQIIFEHGEVANISCASLGQYTGALLATCNNDTFDYTGDEPSCIAYCPLSSDILGEGLHYSTAMKPIENDSNSDTLYYSDGIVIKLSCRDGYEDLNCSSPPNCQRTCNDGTWDPIPFPACTSETYTPMTTMMSSSGSKFTTNERDTNTDLHPTSHVTMTSLTVTLPEVITEAMTAETSTPMTMMTSTSGSELTTNERPTDSDLNSTSHETMTSLPVTSPEVITEAMTERTTTKELVEPSVSQSMSSAPPTEPPSEPPNTEAWKIAVGVTVPLVVIIVACVVGWCYWRRGSCSDSSSDNIEGTYQTDVELDNTNKMDVGSVVNDNSYEFQ